MNHGVTARITVCMLGAARGLFAEGSRRCVTVTGEPETIEPWELFLRVCMCDCVA